MEDIYKYIDDHKEKFIREYISFVGYPSVSVNGYGVIECAEFLREQISNSGILSEIFPTSTYPVVFGETAEVKGLKTLLLKSHYDVVDPGPLDQWKNDPFLPVIDDNRVWGRGSGDAKGQVYAVVKAIEAWNKTRGGLPINVKLFFLGDDEIGAPSLSGFLETCGYRLKADAAAVVDASTLDVWGPALILGARGLLVLEFIAKGAKYASHSGSFGGLLKNPAVRLVNALASMRNSKGEIFIDGFYDQVRPLGETEKELVKILEKESNQEQKLSSLGADHLWGDPGFSYFETQQYRPSFNINSISSGFQGDGWELIVPTIATAKVDINIVPNMDTQYTIEKIRKHLDEKGFTDIEFNVLGASSFVQWIEPEDPFVAVVKRAQERVWKKRTVLYPSIGGGGGSQTKKKLGIPHYLMIPLGQPDMNEHSPRENLHLDWYINGIKVLATLFEEFAKDEFICRGLPENP